MDEKRVSRSWILAAFRLTLASSIWLAMSARAEAPRLIELPLIRCACFRRDGKSSIFSSSREINSRSWRRTPLNSMSIFRIRSVSFSRIVSSRPVSRIGNSPESTESGSTGDFILNTVVKLSCSVFIISAKVQPYVTEMAGFTFA